MAHISDFFGNFSGIFERKNILNEIERWCADNNISVHKGSVEWKGEDIYIKAPQSNSAALFLKQKELVQYLKERFPKISFRTVRIIG